MSKFYSAFAIVCLRISLSFIFSIIPNEVPVEEDEVLGSEFFQDNSVNINYTSKCLEIENHCYSFKSTNPLLFHIEQLQHFMLI